MKISLPVLLAALTLAASAALAPALAQSPCPRPLSFGWEEAPPYQGDASGELDGFDIAMMDAIFGTMGCEIVHRKVPWERHKADLRSGAIDMAAGIARVGDREEWLHYSIPYRVDVTALWVLAERVDGLGFETFAEVAGTGWTFGHRRGYSHGGGFQELLAAPGGERRIQAVDSDEQNLEKLLRGRIEGFFGEEAMIRPLLRRRDLSERVVAHPVPVYSGDSYVVFSKASVERSVVDAFDTALGKIRADGIEARIRARYLE